MEAFLDPRSKRLARTRWTPDRRRARSARPARMERRSSSAAAATPSGGVWLFLDDVSELRRLQRIRTEFIDNLSHELRTPLTTVSLLAETLAREADAVGAAIPAKMRERIAKVEVETGHLVQMVNELLDLSPHRGRRHAAARRRRRPGRARRRRRRAAAPVRRAPGRHARGSTRRPGCPRSAAMPPGSARSSSTSSTTRSSSAPTAAS